MSHRHDPNLDPSALAALYAVGAMTRQEREAFEARLDAGEEACIHEVSSLCPVIDELVSATPPIEPPASIRRDLLARIADDHEHAVADETTPPAEVFTMTADEGEWQETGVQGVRIRVLYVDHEINRQSYLVRMDPGVSFPSHPHHGAEECLVLEGDLTSAGQTLYAGDYQRAPAGSQHSVTSTKNGCLCLVTAAAA